MHAHDEVEERVLVALRRLDYWQSIVIAKMVEALGREKAAGFGKLPALARE